MGGLVVDWCGRHVVCRVELAESLTVIVEPPMLIGIHLHSPAITYALTFPVLDLLVSLRKSE